MTIEVRDRIAFTARMIAILWLVLAGAVAFVVGGVRSAGPPPDYVSTPVYGLMVLWPAALAGTLAAWPGWIVYTVFTADFARTRDRVVAAVVGTILSPVAGTAAVTAGWFVARNLGR